jgi:hypothetical protein
MSLKYCTKQISTTKKQYVLVPGTVVRTRNELNNFILYSFEDPDRLQIQILIELENLESRKIILNNRINNNN